MKQVLMFFMAGIIFLLPSCEECELEREIRVQIEWNHVIPAIEQSAAWQEFGRDSLHDLLESELNFRMPEPGQILIVDTLPDYILRIDKLDGYSATEEQTLEDPCQEEQTALQNFVFGGPETTTFTIHSHRARAEIILLRASTLTGKRFVYTGISSESTIQPATTDTVNCNAYVVAGIIHPRYAVSSLAAQISTQAKCMLHELTR